MSNEIPISLLLFDAVDTGFVYEAISKYLNSREYILYYIWPVLSVRDHDAFMLITTKYYTDYFNSNVISDLCCMIIFDNNNSIQTNAISNFLRLKLLEQSYMKPVFFSEDPEVDFDTFKIKCCIESKFTDLRLKYEIILPALEITYPIFLKSIFVKDWDRTNLPDDYLNLIQNLCNDGYDVKVRLHTLNIFELFINGDSKFYCNITSCVVFVWAFRPISINDLVKLYKYIYVVAHALISHRASPIMMRTVWTFTQGVYNDPNALASNSVKYDIVSPFIKVSSYSMSMCELENTRSRIFYGDFGKLYTILKAIK